MNPKRRVPWLLSALLVGGCTPEEPADTAAPLSGLLVLADTGNGRMLLVDPETRELVGEQCLEELFPDHCEDQSGLDGSACLLFGMEPAPGDTTAWEIVSGWYDADITGIPGGVTRFVPGHPPEIHWHVEQIVFHPDLPVAGACAEGGSDTGATDTGESGTDPDCVLNMPHVATWNASESQTEAQAGSPSDPQTDSQLLVADTLNSRVVWLQELGEDGSEGEPGVVVRLLNENTEGWGDLLYPNNVQVLSRDTFPDHAPFASDDGRTYLLVTYKSTADTEVADRNAGRIVLWDITSSSDPAVVWRYPEEGHLAAVHHGRVQAAGDALYLVYAHSLGAGDDFVEGEFGSVGLARFEGRSPPVYLADGLAPLSAPPPLGFVREVEIVDGSATGDAADPDADPDGEDSTLLVTDSGCENQQDACFHSPRVIRFALPHLDPPGTGGAFSPDHEDQHFVELSLLSEPYDPGLRFPFEADWLDAETAERIWADDTAWGPCP